MSTSTPILNLSPETFQKLMGPGVRQLLMSQIEADVVKAMQESVEKRLGEFAQALLGTIERFDRATDNTIVVTVNFNGAKVSEATSK